MMINNNIRKTGIIGWPAKHSMSPRIHNYWIQKYNIKSEYILLEVAPKNLKKTINELHLNGFSGVNITIPHKESVMPLVKNLDKNSVRLGAINTININEDGGLEGSNTDGYGFIRNLFEQQPKWSINEPVVILGAGGAARAIAFAMLDEGVPEVRIVNRSNRRGEDLIAHLGPRSLYVPWEFKEKALMDAHMLINATSLGMSGQPILDISLDNFSTSGCVVDIVYSPKETALLKMSAKRGNKCIGGLGMLLYQAAASFSVWHDFTPEITQNLINIIEREI